MKPLFVAFALGLVGNAAFGVNIAVIDSGVDYKHVDLKNNIWNNPASPQDLVVNGKTYTAATNGWNFAEANNQIIDYKYLGKFSADCTTAFETQAKIQMGTATADEKTWYKQKKADPAFLTELTTFGNFVHGTHVSGISAKNAPDAKIIGLKIIPTERPTRPFVSPSGNRAADNILIKSYLSMVAHLQANSLTEAGKFTAVTEARVANGSFGVSVGAMKPTIGAIVKQVTGTDPSDDDKTDYAKALLDEMITASASFPAASPDTLFVFAAGNDGTDNSFLPVSPANIRGANVITVAATNGTASLATFSNYSETLVEVAAPGVAIDSTVPGDQHLQMSGTSMAAPFVTNVAGLILDENSALTSAEVKKILMTTVDVKAFLKGKVSTSGVVNKERALLAARLSTSVALDQALVRARQDVSDQAEQRSIPESAVKDLIVLPLPSPL